MKRYVASEFFSALDKINSDMDRYTDTLNNVYSAIQGVVNLGDNLTGQGGEALKNFYANNHVPLLSYWTMACQQVKIATAKMRMYALSFESRDAVIDESFIEGEVIPQLEKNQRRIQQRQDRINGIIDSVSDIVSLPRLDTGEVQEGIHEAKQHAMNTVEKLYAFDHAQSATVDQLISLMAPISSFIAGLNGAIESGVNITALAGYIASQDVPPEIKAMHPMLNSTYSVLNPYHDFKDQAVHTQNFSFSPNPFGFIYFSNPFIVNVANWFYLASEHIDVVHHYSPDHQIAGTMLDANGNEIQNISQIPQERYINACASPSLLQDNDELAASDIENASAGSVEKETGSTILDFIPVVGNIKSGVEAVIGKDLITGRELEEWERYLAGAAIIGGPIVKGTSKGIRAVNNVSNGTKISNPAHSAAQYDRLRTHYYQGEKYGKAEIRELPDGRYRYYRPITPPKKPGEMAGRRVVREWDPATGRKRTWGETVDHNGNIRQVRPNTEFTNGVKVHYIFDKNGNYIGRW
ncbi:T7SS effector LXG polymorphic toxin [Bacillus sp. FSL K6-0047]